jgi:hypothetical protein
MSVLNSLAFAQEEQKHHQQCLNQKKQKQEEEQMFKLSSDFNQARSDNPTGTSVSMRDLAMIAHGLVGVLLMLEEKEKREKIENRKRKSSSDDDGRLANHHSWTALDSTFCDGSSAGGAIHQDSRSLQFHTSVGKEWIGEKSEGFHALGGGGPRQGSVLPGHDLLNSTITKVQMERSKYTSWQIRSAVTVRLAGLAASLAGRQGNGNSQEMAMLISALPVLLGCPKPTFIKWGR